MGWHRQGGVCHVFLADPLVMEDHIIISRARQELAAALTSLLKADIMDAVDFNASKNHALAALAALDDLLRFQHRNRP